MTAIAVEGFTADDPIDNLDDWLDCVRWDVNRNWAESKHHDRDGFLCDTAGGPECLALGHKPQPVTDEDADILDDGWDDEEHPLGWDFERICPATRSESACTTCESPDCPWTPFDPTALWKAVSKEAQK